MPSNTHVWAVPCYKEEIDDGGTLCLRTFFGTQKAAMKCCKHCKACDKVEPVEFTEVRRRGKKKTS